MTFPNQLKFAAGASPSPSGALQPSSRTASNTNPIFFGPNGLRAGWRLLIFVVLVAVLLTTFVLIRSGGLQGFREAQKHAAELTVTSFLMGWLEACAFLLICVATLIMGKIEHRKFGTYGLPLNVAFKKDFWVGISCGFSGISGTLLVMFLLHGFRITGFALHGTAILSAMGGWGIAFLLAALFEEFLCRGYAQYTLGSGIGFWPAAFIMSSVFALGHAFNPNETLVGVLAVVLFGLLLCLFLQRTGNLWCAVGFHMAYDWGQTFFGVADSGMLPYHSVFSSAFHGPRWLTGGIVGPEASILTPIALLVVALVFSWFHRENRYQVSAT